MMNVLGSSRSWLQFCSDDHTRTTSPNQPSPAAPWERDKDDRIEHLLLYSNFSFFAGGQHRFRSPPTMDSLSHTFNDGEQSVPVRSCVSAKDWAPWSCLFPAWRGEGEGRAGFLCWGVGVGLGAGGEGKLGSRKQRKLWQQSLLYSSFFVSLFPCSVSMLVKISLHSFFCSPRPHSEQFGANWMNRNKRADIAADSWLLQGPRHWLEAHSPFYAHSKQMGKIRSS